MWLEFRRVLFRSMACSRRLDQTGMYLKNEYSVFKGHPDFRPYKVSLTRILRFRVGLVGALWLSLQDYIRFVLTFSVFYTAGLRQKNTPLVSQRGIKDDSILFSVNWYPSFLVTIWVTANASKSLCCNAECFHGFPHLKTVFPFLFSDCYWVKSVESLLTCPCLFKYLY